MKNICLVLISIVITAIFFSCSDDDKENSASIIGKWQVVSVEDFECANTSENEKLQCSAGSYTFCQVIEFTSDQTFTSYRIWDNQFMGSGKYYGPGEGKFSIGYTNNPYGSPDNITYDFTVSASALITIYTGSSCRTRTVYTKI